MHWTRNFFRFTPSWFTGFVIPLLSCIYMYTIYKGPIYRAEKQRKKSIIKILRVVYNIPGDRRHYISLADNTFGRNKSHSIGTPCSRRAQVITIGINWQLWPKGVLVKPEYFIIFTNLITQWPFKLLKY